MYTELDILRDVILSLDEINIPYMLTGSMAMIYYAQPRMTRDIDMVMELSVNDIVKFVSSFKNKYYVPEDILKDSIATNFMFNIIHLESSIKIDCILRKNDEYRKFEFNRRKKVKFADIEVFIVSKEDLILSKLYWAKDSRSDLQIRDINNLIITGYDKEYINLWLPKLGLKQIFEEING